MEVALIILGIAFFAALLIVSFRLGQLKRQQERQNRVIENQAEKIAEYERLNAQLKSLLDREGQGVAAEQSPGEILLKIEDALRFYRKHQKERIRDNVSNIDTASGHASDEQWLQELEACIRENIPDHQFNVNRLAGLMQISRKELYRRLREHVGLSVNAYIQEIRLLVAREKIESGSASNLGALAESVGLRSANYLSRLYRARFNRSPME